MAIVLFLTGCSGGNSQHTPATTSTAAAGGVVASKGAAVAALPKTSGIVRMPRSGKLDSAGPFRVESLSALHSLVSKSPKHDDDTLAPQVDVASLGLSSVITTAEKQATFNENALSAAHVNTSSTRRAKSLGVGAAYETLWDTNIAGASDGSKVVSTGNGYVYVFSIGGSLLSKTAQSSFFCGPSSPLPVCSVGDQFTDARVRYDVASSRYVISAESSSTGITDVLAVTTTSDPGGSWYLYQFSACGDGNGTDQPHLGVSAPYIVVNSTCTHSGDTGLTVFDKPSIYAGATLSLNSNVWQFADTLNTGGGDNPATQYTSDAYDMLDEAIVTSNTAAVVQSFVIGSPPVFYQGGRTIYTGFPASLPYPAVVDTPGCSGCLDYRRVNFKIHSSGLYKLPNGDSVLLATWVAGDPAYTNSTQIIGIAYDELTGVTTAMRLEGGEVGSGPMASEIAMPINGATNLATIVYDHSRSDFYPGVKVTQWDVSANNVNYVTSLHQGSTSPIQFAQGRWADFLDNMSPLPGSASIFVGGATADYMGQDMNDNAAYATYWATITP